MCTCKQQLTITVCSVCIYCMFSCTSPEGAKERDIRQTLHLRVHPGRSMEGEVWREKYGGRRRRQQGAVTFLS